MAIVMMVMMITALIRGAPFPMEFHERSKNRASLISQL